MAQVSRRTLLKALGWSAVGITAVAATTAQAFPVLPYRGDPNHADAAGWVSLRPDGRYELWSPRAEMGQGVSAGLCQIVADELDTTLANVRCVVPDSGLIGPVRATVGSDSIKDYAALVAQAAAGLALAVRARAADRLGVAADAVRLSDDAATTADGASVPLADLAGADAVLLDADLVARATPRFGDRTIAPRHVGQARPTDGIEAIVTGDVPLFADDVRLPGMVFGAVVRSDGIGGEVRQVDDSACRAIAGYLGLVRDGDMIGVLAERRGALAAALTALQFEDLYDDTVSSASLAAAIDVDRGLAGGRLEHDPHDADIAADEPFDIDLRFDVPPAAHAAMEPRTAVARFDADGRLELWTGSQDVFFVRGVVADDLGLSEDRVVVHGMRLGGAFGGRVICAVELDAARLARAAGRPVKVQWSRRDEFRAAYHRPPSSHRIRARLDKDGSIAVWWHAFRSGHVIFTSAAMGPVLQFFTGFVPDFGVARGSTPPYAIDRMRVEFDDVRIPVLTGAWRGLGAGPNGWAMESAIDALARTSGNDPLAFRRHAIADTEPRLRRVLDRAADIADWAARPPRPDRALGIACGIYKEMSYAAVVADVDLSEPVPRVVGLWCAHDCGQVINPDQVRAQVEGNLVWGIGMALHEDLEVAGGRIVATSQHDYALARFADVPDIAVDLIDSAAPPTGAGETAIVAAAAAITNAIAAATGQPVTRLPYRA